MTLWGGARRTSSTLAAIGTTSYDVRGLRRPAAASQGLLDLREELVPSHAESEQRQPQHPSSLQRHVVLADRVTDDLRRPAVLDAVDLHDQVPRLPEKVEVVCPVPSTPEDLPTGLGQPAPATLTQHVELPERLHPSQQIEHDRVDEPATLVPPDREHRLRDLLGRGEPLLNCHRQGQGRLAVRPRPQRLAYGGHLRSRARNP